MAHDYVVIGGGVIGLMTARELALSGARVGIVERGETGRESSWAGGGILSPVRPWQHPDALTRLVQWGQTAYPDLVRALREETSIDAEWQRSGLMILDEDPVQTAAAHQWAERHHSPLQTLTSRDVKQIVPALGIDDAPGLWWPEVGQLRNPRLLRALKASVLTKGVTLHEYREVTRLLRENDRVVGVEAKGEAMRAGAVIVAGGAWSQELLKDMGIRLEVEPVRGQIILYRADRVLFTPVIAHRDYYLIPRRDGHVLVGSTVEKAGFNKTTTAAARQELEAAGQGLIPVLADFPVVAHWAGLRPGSPTGIPVIGPHPLLKGLYINTGHFRNGLSLAPGSARLLADLIFDRKSGIDPAPYLPQPALLGKT